MAVKAYRKKRIVNREAKTQVLNVAERLRKGRTERNKLLRLIPKVINDIWKAMAVGQW